MSKKTSQRFSASGLSEKLMPVIFVLLLIGLLAVMLVTGLAILGITPSA